MLHYGGDRQRLGGKMSKGYRQGRLGEEIRRIISELLIRGLKDPRLSAMISITAVEVTSDGSYATVFVSVLVHPPMRKRQRNSRRKFLLLWAVPRASFAGK